MSDKERKNYMGIQIAIVAASLLLWGVVLTALLG